MKKPGKGKRKFRIGRIIISILVVVALGAGYMFYTESQKPKNAASGINFTRVKADIGDIEVTVYGAGALEAANIERVFSESTGKVYEILKEVGDTVAVGDVIAKLSNDDIDSQIASLENELAALDVSLASARAPSTTEKIKSPSDGRIKLIKVKEDDDAYTIYKENGYIAMLSTDGQMRIDMTLADGAATKVGDIISIKLPDGTAQAGVVSELIGTTKATVLIPNDEIDVQESVDVFSESGILVGSGKLVINRPLPITAVSGIISDVSVDENDLVDHGDTLFTMEDVVVSTSFETSRLSRASKQTELDNAKKIRDNLNIVSDKSGTITEMSLKIGDMVQDEAAIASIMVGNELKIVVGVDELDINRVQVGQTISLRLDAMEGERFGGIVTKIAPIGTYSNGVTNFDVTVAIDPVVGARPGMSGSADIVVDSKKDVVRVPVEAVQEIGDKKFVLLASEMESLVAAAKENSSSGGMFSGFSAMFNGARNTRSQVLGTRNGANGATGSKPTTNSASGTNIKNGANFAQSAAMRIVEVGLMNETYAEIITGLEEGEEIAIIVNTTTTTTNAQFMTGGMSPGMAPNMGTNEKFVSGGNPGRP